MSEMYGGCYEHDLTNIFLSYSKKNKMRYSHKKRNQWNLWEDNSGLVLSFNINKGLMVPCLVGIARETLEKFYCSNPAQVDSWVKEDIIYYYQTLKELLQHPEEQRAPKEVEQVKKLVKTKRTPRKQTQVEGQMSFEDLGYKF